MAPFPIIIFSFYQSMLCAPYRIVREVPALVPDFWEQVASRLPTNHTARECSTKYMEACTRPSTKKQKVADQPDKSEGDKKILITGKAGTLKRKRQLQAAMEHLDKGYADDIFESTPFKKKVKTVVKVSFSVHVWSSCLLRLFFHSQKNVHCHLSRISSCVW